MNEIAVLKHYTHHFQPQIPKFREDKYIQILVLRETKSHTIFTTEGQALNIEQLPAGIENPVPIKRAVMYKRKQIAPERRTGKSLLRQFDLCPSHDVKDKNGKIVVPKGECQITGHPCGICPDCILYGFVVTSNGRAGSQRARVLTDSGFIIRELSKVMRDVKMNAINETTNGAVVSGAYSHRENLIPEVFIPTVETLVDVTREEFIYVMGNILRTTRYGAESRREGFVRNHILGVYFSDVEVFSNLELSQHFYDVLGIDHTKTRTFSLNDFTDNLMPVVNKCVEKAVGRVSIMTDTEVLELVHDIGVIYGTQEYLAAFVRRLNKMSSDYISQTQRYTQGQIQNAREQQNTRMAV